MFDLPGRGFHQRITSTSSVPMTLNDVFIHTRQFVIALVSVDGCSTFPDPDGFLDVPDSSVGFLVCNFHPPLPVYGVVFSNTVEDAVLNYKPLISGMAKPTG